MLQAKKISGDALGIDAGKLAGVFRPTATMPADLPASLRRAYGVLASRAGRQAFAAIKLHCLDCVCWHRTEARDCQISTCSLWALNRRIFKGDAEA
jgi:hypothetical protein